MKENPTLPPRVQMAMSLVQMYQFRLTSSPVLAGDAPCVVEPLTGPEKKNYHLAIEYINRYFLGEFDD